MIRKLRFKFVITIFLIAAILIGIIFALVYIDTKIGMEQNSIQLMQEIAKSPSSLRRPGDPTPNTVLPYFVISISDFGTEVETNGNFDISDESFLKTLEDVLSQSSTITGEISEYSLRYYKAKDSFRTVIVFVDITSEIATVRNLSITLLIIGFSALLFITLISVFLSKAFVKPVETAFTRQKQFVSDASHELKTPLAVIMTNAQLLQSETSDPASEKRYIDNIYNMSEEMRSLVNNLLELARIDNGAISKTSKELDFSSLLSDALLVFETMFFESGFALDTDIENGISVFGNDYYLRELINIFMDNANKYTESGGHIHVELKKSRHNVFLFSVTTTGPEIPQNELKLIFNRFYRCDSARSSSQSYGLGLAIASDIVSLHKGKVWAESGNHQNTFYVQLPQVKSAKADSK